MEGERDRLLSIGRFAFLTGLSKRALRFYDESGLLRPAAVDDWTGYRYYSLEQMAIANQIRRLREIDLPLDEVGQALSDPAAVEGLLTRHELRLLERAAESERALSLLRRLREEKEKPVPITFELRDLPAVSAACVEMRTAYDTIGADCEKAFGRLMTELRAAGVEPSGPCVIGYPEEPDANGSFMALVGVQIAGDLPPGSVLKAVDLPGGRAAFGTLTGPYEGLHQAWQDAVTWLGEQGLKMSNMPYEIYRVDHLRASSPEKIETDIVLPVA